MFLVKDSKICVTMAEQIGKSEFLLMNSSITTEQLTLPLGFPALSSQSVRVKLCVQCREQPFPPSLLLECPAGIGKFP